MSLDSVNIPQVEDNSGDSTGLSTKYSKEGSLRVENLFIAVNLEKAVAHVATQLCGYPPPQ